MQICNRLVCFLHLMSIDDQKIGHTTIIMLIASFSMDEKQGSSMDKKRVNEEVSP